MKDRYKHNGIDRPYSVYEVHLGSWKKNEKNESLSYRELATDLVEYVQKMNYTHVEFLPVMEHPYFPSWGYQITGYFAPSSRFGGPQDFMYLVDKLHAAGIGVILDWVPSHFPNDAHGLAQFDGTHLYDHADPRKGFHPDWKSAIFNYGRNEVRSFLISNALFWLDRYHIDGLRVDAVASMLYLDYSRKAGEWIPNQYGGNENLEAIDFIREFNEAVYRDFPDTMTIAEESTAFSGVSRPTYVGGLGFGQKWMMGWMHDTLNYFKNDPVHRSYHHGELTFSLVYAVDQRSGSLTPLEYEAVAGDWPRNLALSPDERYLLVANQRSKNITTLARSEKTGMLDYVTSTEAPIPVCIRF
jgi:1,4-alpha-glucan branching enzyme